MKAYLVLVTWPDGTEGLLFPRPGNVPIATTEEQGLQDLGKAHRDLMEFLAAPGSEPNWTGPVTLRLVVFERGETLAEVTE